MGPGRLACVPVHSRCGVWGRGMRKREFSPLPSTGAWGGGGEGEKERGKFSNVFKEWPKEQLQRAGSELDKAGWNYGRAVVEAHDEKISKWRLYQRAINVSLTVFLILT